jgi:tetratricopeptide (TPR) repeat protein
MRFRSVCIVGAIGIVLLCTASAAAQPVLAPTRSNLQPVPLPLTDALEPAVVAQLASARADVQRTSATGGRELADAYGELAQILHVYELFDGAEAAYRNAMRLASTDVRWPHLLGYLFAQTGRLDEAVERFADVLRLHPSHREATAHLAEVNLRRGRLAVAREQFQTIVEAFPAFANNGLGEIALREERFDEAIRRLHAVLERIPTATAVHYPLAMAYRGLGRLDDARRHLDLRGAGTVRVSDPLVDRIRTLVRGERALVLQGRELYEAGQFSEAADAFRRAAAAAPASATAHVNLGLALVQAGDRSSAIDAFRAAAAAAPDDVAAHASLGALLAETGRLGEAAEHLRAAFDRAPEAAATRTLLLRTLIRLGRTDDALTVLARAASLDPDDEGVTVDLAILLADRMRYRDAIARLQDGHQRHPERAAIATTLARLLAAAPDRTVRDGRRALEIATAVHTAAPGPVHRETVALALAEIGRCQEASEWMRKAIEEARQTNEIAEAVRLESELPKYGGTECRP